MDTDERGLGRLEQLDPREVWKSESSDLTPWLIEHLDLLATSLGISIVPTERERRVGNFSLDVLGEDESGRPVIVENQLEPTNHTHLGQLLVYASGLGAAVVVWLTPSFRDEHRSALDWLNERTDEQVHFFGVELGLVRIGDSPPAPIFRVVAQPNDWQKAVKSATGISNLAQSRHDFFERLVDSMAKERVSFRKPKPGYDNWMGMAAGPFGYYSVAFVLGNQVRAELYLDCGDQATNKLVFDELDADRAELEDAFGEALSWERLDNRRASRVGVYRPTPDLADEQESEQARAWAAARLFRLIDVFDHRLRTRFAELKAEGAGAKAASGESSALPTPEEAVQ